MDESDLAAEFQKLKGKTSTSWTEFANDLKIFETNTATAHPSDLVTTSNPKKNVSFNGH